MTPKSHHSKEQGLSIPHPKIVKLQVSEEAAPQPEPSTKISELSWQDLYLLDIQHIKVKPTMLFNLSGRTHAAGIFIVPDRSKDLTHYTAVSLNKKELTPLEKGSIVPKVQAFLNMIHNKTHRQCFYIHRLQMSNQALTQILSVYLGLESLEEIEKRKEAMRNKGKTFYRPLSLHDKMPFRGSKHLTVKECIDQKPSTIKWALETLNRNFINQEAKEYYAKATRKH
jgi:hypothetical protein